jgi:hypothetical protein
MRTLAHISLGAMIGVAWSVFCICAFGLVIDALGMPLYRSEADQQQNFNVALLFTVAFALAGGWLGHLVARRRRHDATRATPSDGT